MFLHSRFLYAALLDGRRLICAAYENDPEKTDIHRPEMMAKFRIEGIID